MNGSNVTGSITHDGVQMSSNTMDDAQMRATLQIEPPAESETPAESATPEAESASPETLSSPTTDPQVSEKPAKRTKDPQARIDKLTFEREEAKREAARLKAEADRQIGTLREEFQRELAELRRMAQPKAERESAPANEADPEPNPEDTTKYPDGQFDRKYLKDQARWEARQEFASLEQQRREQYQQQQAMRSQQQRQQAELTRIQTLQSRMEKAFTADPSLQAKLETVSMTRPMWDVAMESERPDQILAYMADHPEEAERIASLPPLHAFRALSRIEYELESAATTGSATPGKPKTSAHPPVSPVSGSHAAPASGPPGPDASYEEHAAYYNALEAKQRSGRR